MDGLLALDIWDIVIEVLHSTNDKTQPKHTSHQETGTFQDFKTKTQHVIRKQKVDQWSEVDHVPHILLTVSLTCIFLKTMKL